MMERIIAVNSNCYHGYSIEEAIAGIKAAGFKVLLVPAAVVVGNMLYALMVKLFLLPVNRIIFF